MCKVAGPQPIENFARQGWLLPPWVHSFLLLRPQGDNISLSLSSDLIGFKEWGKLSNSQNCYYFSRRKIDEGKIVPIPLYNECTTKYMCMRRSTKSVMVGLCTDACSMQVTRYTVLNWIFVDELKVVHSQNKKQSYSKTIEHWII